MRIEPVLVLKFIVRSFFFGRHMFRARERAKEVGIHGFHIRTIFVTRGVSIELSPFSKPPVPDPSQGIVGCDTWIEGMGKSESRASWKERMVGWEI